MFILYIYMVDIKPVIDGWYKAQSNDSSVAEMKQASKQQLALIEKYHSANNADVAHFQRLATAKYSLNLHKTPGASSKQSVLQLHRHNPIQNGLRGVIYDFQITLNEPWS